MKNPRSAKKMMERIGTGNDARIPKRTSLNSTFFCFFFFWQIRNKTGKKCSARDSRIQKSNLEPSPPKSDDVWNFDSKFSGFLLFWFLMKKTRKQFISKGKGDSVQSRRVQEECWILLFLGEGCSNSPCKSSFFWPQSDSWFVFNGKSKKKRTGIFTSNKIEPRIDS